MVVTTAAEERSRASEPVANSWLIKVRNWQPMQAAPGPWVPCTNGSFGLVGELPRVGYTFPGTKADDGG